jgi:hypothetical protein
VVGKGLVFGLGFSCNITRGRRVNQDRGRGEEQQANQKKTQRQMQFRKTKVVICMYAT